MARCSSITATVLACIVFYYVLGIWFDRSLSPAVLRQSALQPVKKYSQRIVAVGDLHGDVHHAIRVLKMAGLVDHRNKWIGKRSILVQTGDIVDRGKDVIPLYHLFDELRLQAAAAGGAVINLLGNHEYMNAMGDWRYVTEEDIATFGGERNRRKAMSGDGWIGKTWLSNYSVTARVPYADEFVPFPDLAPAQPAPTAAVAITKKQAKFAALPQEPPRQWTFGTSAKAPTNARLESTEPFAFAAASFVHGGINELWARKGRARAEPAAESSDQEEADGTQGPIEYINEVGHSLLSKAIDTPYLPLNHLPKNTTAEELAFYGSEGPLWWRDYALEEDEQSICDQADEVRRLLGVRRLVMGHTPNLTGIRSRCKGKVLLIDTGITRAYGGRLSALEITYSLAPVIPQFPDGTFMTLPNPRLGDADQRWRESEVVSALYEDVDKVTLVKADRMITLPLDNKLVIDVDLDDD